MARPRNGRKRIRPYVEGVSRAVRRNKRTVGWWRIVGLIKITAGDKWFSECVRERAAWTCQRCKTQYNRDDKNSRMGLHCAHWHSRGNWFTRFDVSNALALCMGCHLFTQRERDEHRKLMLQHYGEIELDRLAYDRNRPAYGVKKRVSEIAKHYRGELAKMQAQRAEGVTGRLEFEGWSP